MTGPKIRRGTMIYDGTAGFAVPAGAAAFRIYRDFFVVQNSRPIGGGRRFSFWRTINTKPALDAVSRYPDSSAGYGQCLDRAALGDTGLVCTGCPDYDPLPLDYEPKIRPDWEPVYVVGGGIRLPGPEDDDLWAGPEDGFGEGVTHDQDQHDT